MNDLLSDVWQLVFDGSNYPSTLSYTQHSLNQGKYYRFRIIAINSVGSSQPGPDSSFLAADFPSAPTQPQLVASTSNSVQIKWNPPSDNGGATITGYEIYFKKATEDETMWILVGTTDINTLTFTHTGITGTDDVQYKVKATSNVGDGTFSPRNTFILASTPTISNAPLMVMQSKNSITVSWSLTSNGGSPLLGYKLY